MIVVKAQATLLLIIQPPGRSITLPAQSCQVRQAEQGDCCALWKKLSALPALACMMGEARLKGLGALALHRRDGDHIHMAGW